MDVLTWFSSLSTGEDRALAAATDDAAFITTALRLSVENHYRFQDCRRSRSQKRNMVNFSTTTELHPSSGEAFCYRRRMLHLLHQENLRSPSNQCSSAVRESMTVSAIDDVSACVHQRNLDHQRVNVPQKEISLRRGTQKNHSKRTLTKSSHGCCPNATRQCAISLLRELQSKIILMPDVYNCQYNTKKRAEKVVAMTFHPQFLANHEYIIQLINMLIASVNGTGLRGTKSNGGFLSAGIMKVENYGTWPGWFARHGGLREEVRAQEEFTDDAVSKSSKVNCKSQNLRDCEGILFVIARLEMAIRASYRNALRAIALSRTAASSTVATECCRRQMENDSSVRASSARSEFSLHRSLLFQLKSAPEKKLSKDTTVSEWLSSCLEEMDAKAVLLSDYEDEACVPMWVFTHLLLKRTDGNVDVGYDQSSSVHDILVQFYDIACRTLPSLKVAKAMVSGRSDEIDRAGSSAAALEMRAVGVVANSDTRNCTYHVDGITKTDGRATEVSLDVKVKKKKKRKKKKKKQSNVVARDAEPSAGNVSNGSTRVETKSQPSPPRCKEKNGQTQLKSVMSNEEKWEVVTGKSRNRNSLKFRQDAGKCGQKDDVAHLHGVDARSESVPAKSATNNISKLSKPLPRDCDTSASRNSIDLVNDIISDILDSVYNEVGNRRKDIEELPSTFRNLEIHENVTPNPEHQTTHKVETEPTAKNANSSGESHSRERHVDYKGEIAPVAISSSPSSEGHIFRCSRDPSLPIPTVLGMEHDNSASSSVSSSLEPPTAAVRHFSHKRLPRESGKEEGYHLLGVCEKLSCDMELFMQRRAAALEGRRKERRLLLNALQATVSKLWGKEGARVEMYGSCATQLDLPSSDLDVVVCGVDNPRNRVPGRKKYRNNFVPRPDCQHNHFGLPDQYYLNPNAYRVQRLAMELEQQPWAVQVKAIPTAMIPVVKILADPYCLPEVFGTGISGETEALHGEDVKWGTQHPVVTDNMNSMRNMNSIRTINGQQSLCSLEKSAIASPVVSEMLRQAPWRGADLLNGLVPVDITFEGSGHGGIGSTAFSAAVVQNACHEDKLPPEASPTIQLVMVLKELLAQRRLNEPFSGGLSSYSLLLMVCAVVREGKALKANLANNECHREHAVEHIPSSVNTVDVHGADVKESESGRTETVVDVSVGYSSLPVASSWASIAKNKPGLKRVAEDVTKKDTTKNDVAKKDITKEKGISYADKAAGKSNGKVRDLEKSISMDRSTMTSPTVTVTLSSDDVGNNISSSHYMNGSARLSALCHGGSNDVLDVLYSSGKITAGKLLLHFLLFYGKDFDAQTTAVDVNAPGRPFVQRTAGGQIDPVTGMFSVDPIAVYDPLVGQERKIVSKSCFAWYSIRQVFHQCFATLVQSVDSGVLGGEHGNEPSPLLALLLSF